MKTRLRVRHEQRIEDEFCAYALRLHRWLERHFEEVWPHTEYLSGEQLAEIASAPQRGLDTAAKEG